MGVVRRGGRLLASVFAVGIVLLVSPFLLNEKLQLVTNLGRSPIFYGEISPLLKHHVRTTPHFRTVGAQGLPRGIIAASEDGSLLLNRYAAYGFMVAVRGISTTGHVSTRGICWLEQAQLRMQYHELPEILGTAILRHRALRWQRKTWHLDILAVLQPTLNQAYPVVLSYSRTDI